MEYNTQRKKMELPEYGRSVQNMVDHALTIEDREERQRCANTIVNIMGGMFPQLRDVPDFKHKLWDHLAIMSDFKLDIDYPFEIVKPEELEMKPERIPYASNAVRYRHYGRFLEGMVKKAMEMEEGEEKEAFIHLLAIQMKKNLNNWNKEGIEDQKIVDDLREYSVEAGRPETINRKKLELMRDFNVTRISINPQTMMNDVLRGVGRNHTKDDIIEKFNLAREVGNFVINMDLIAGLPGDDEAGLLESVREVCKLDPDNVTVHSLAKKRGAAVIYDNHYDLEAKTLNKAHKYIRGKGYEPYYIYRQKYIAGGLENTGFAKNGTISFYNVAMMEELCTVIAIGAGGVSKITNNFGMKLDRIANPKYPKEYIDNIESIVKTKRELVFNTNSDI